MTRYLTTEQRRSAIMLAYNDRKWLERVRKMPALQVYAVFEKFKKDGVINFDDNGNIYYRTPKEVQKLKIKREEARSGCHQITLDEFFGDLIEERKEKDDNGKME